MFATYCTYPENSRGRMFKEENDHSTLRDCHQKDVEKIIHSNYFRKLANKAQTFLHYQGDYYRTRLTHSLEVSYITKKICKKMKLNQGLGEAIALSHDIGHPPFGHTGEQALADLTADYEKFDHNVNSLRIVTKIDRSYIDFPGLNLTAETLEGIVKHNGKIDIKHAPSFIKHYNSKHSLELDYNPCLEGQIAKRCPERQIS